MHVMIDLTEGETAGDPGPQSKSAVRVAADAAAEPRVGILAYQAAWESGFRAESELLARAFAAHSPHLEHVGTTAVAGTAARPIVDVLMGVAQPCALRLPGNLRLFGYRTGDCLDNADGTRRLLVRWQRGLPTHHVHVVEYLGAHWRLMLLFRDVLRLDPRLAREYEWLRRRFAGLHPANRVAYARAKATFIQTVVGQAH